MAMGPFRNRRGLRLWLGELDVFWDGIGWVFRFQCPLGALEFARNFQLPMYSVRATAITWGVLCWPTGEGGFITKWHGTKVLKLHDTPFGAGQKI